MGEAVFTLASGREIAVDEKGYLTDPAQWERGVAEHMAREDGIALTPDHFAVIGILRDYHQRFEIEPPMRALVKLVGERLGAEKGSSRFLYRIFPGGPITQGSRYAGLPRPLSCV